MTPNSKRNKSAVTLIELIIVVGIISVVTAAVVPSFSGFSRQKDFHNKVETFVNEIANVRNKSLSGAVVIISGTPTEVHWGIRPICTGSANTYRLGYRTGTTGNIVSVSTLTLPASVKFDPTSCSQIVFARLRGVPHQPGTITLIYGGGIYSRTITVNSSGRIVYDEDKE